MRAPIMTSSAIPSSALSSGRISSKAPLFWLALGAFAIGTESFMISPLLPNLAADFSVSIGAAGQLVAVFALTYAISSPIITAFTGGINRRLLLIAAMIAFTLANIVASLAPNYWSLMGARVLLAIAAGLYSPSAVALAGALVPPDQRGRALAIVGGGTTIAIALGVSLGALIGDGFGWRMTFAGVGLLSALAVIGLVAGLRRGVGAGLPTASLGERIAVARQPAVLLALLATLIWAMGAYVIYTFLALYLSSTVGLQGAQIGLVLFLWGVTAAAGIFLGGALNDRFGPRAVLIPSLGLLALAFISLSLSAIYLSQSQALAPVLIAIVVWGLSAWAFFPAQQARLIAVGGLKAAPVSLSLNASFLYLGFALGAALGSFSLSLGPIANLGWIAGVCEIAALLLVIAITRRAGTAVTAKPVTQTF
jgi:predicted MFS family arabinose efflux permease